MNLNKKIAAFRSACDDEDGVVANLLIPGVIAFIVAMVVSRIA